MVQRDALIEPGGQFGDLGEDEGFEQGAEQRAIPLDALRGGALYGSQESGVEEMQLGRLHEALEPVAVPWFDPPHQEQLFKGGEVFPDGLVVEADARAELREVDELPRVMRRCADQALQDIELSHSSDVSHVSLHDGLQVVARPGSASCRLGAPDHLRIAAAQDCLHQWSAPGAIRGCGQDSRQGLYQKLGLLSQDFAVRERKQADDFHAACEALGDLGQGEHVGRSGEQEPARAAIFIHRALYGAQDLGDALHFVYGGAVDAADKSGRIAAGGCKRGVIVQRDVAAPVADEGAHERSLAALAGAIDHDHRRVLECDGHALG